MNLAKIKLMGLRAFELGLKLTPTANEAFVNALSDELKSTANLREQSKIALHAANAYVSGWTVAKLAKNSPDNATLEETYKMIIENAYNE